MKESGGMKVSSLWIISILIVIFVFSGCGIKDNSSNSSNSSNNNVSTEKETPVAEGNSIEENAGNVSISVAEEGEESMETTDERVAKLYETVQKMIDETDEVYFKKPDYFGTTLFTEDKYEEIKQYEMNIVLEYLGIKFWNRPTRSWDEADLPVDEPLGDYSSEKLLEYTDEEYDLTVEYFCGGSLLHNLNSRYIALIIKEYKNDRVDNLYYQIIDYGYLGVMTGDNCYYYETNKILEDIDREKIEKGDVGHNVHLWLDESAGEVNLIYDIGKEERESPYGTYTSYAQSIWVRLEETETGYKVKEIIPMRLR